MTEKPYFEKSGRVKDINDLAEIEYWGHDAGEFIWEEIEKVITESDDDPPIPNPTSISTRP